MGGSGGGGSGGIFSGSFSPGELRRQVRVSEEQARNDQFETEVSGLIDAQLAEANSRDSEAIGRHLEEIENALGQDIEGSVTLLFGGSVAKRTYVEGLSDVDALVILNNSDLANMEPGQVKEYFAKRLRERFSKTPVEEGTLAVTVRFADAEIQLLPAIKDGGGIRIAAPYSSNWSTIIRPNEFAKKLTAVNQAMNGKLVPTIKLAKTILRKLPDDQQVASYHLESLAIQVFDSYEGPKTTKAMLQYFFSRAPLHIKQPIKDSTGQSIHVDDYLGGPGNLKRRMIGDSLGRIARSMQNADGAQSLDQWTEILNIEP